MRPAISRASHFDVRITPEGLQHKHPSNASTNVAQSNELIENKIFVDEGAGKMYLALSTVFNIFLISEI